MIPVEILDALSDTEHWFNWTRFFGPLSGVDAKLKRPRGAEIGPAVSSARRAMRETALGCCRCHSATAAHCSYFNLQPSRSYTNYSYRVDPSSAKIAFDAKVCGRWKVLKLLEVAHHRCVPRQSQGDHSIRDRKGIAPVGVQRPPTVAEHADPLPRAAVPIAHHW